MGKGRIFAIIFAAGLLLIMLAVISFAVPGGTGTIIRQEGPAGILPYTGGIGTTIFYIAGISIMTGSALYLIFKKKKDT